MTSARWLFAGCRHRRH